MNDNQENINESNDDNTQDSLESNVDISSMPDLNSSVLDLNYDTRLAFVNAINNPPEPTEELKNLMAHGRQFKEKFNMQSNQETAIMNENADEKTIANSTEPMIESSKTSQVLSDSETPDELHGISATGFIGNNGKSHDVEFVIAKTGFIGSDVVKFISLVEDVLSSQLNSGFRDAADQKAGEAYFADDQNTSKIINKFKMFKCMFADKERERHGIVTFYYEVSDVEKKTIATRHFRLHNGLNDEMRKFLNDVYEHKLVETVTVPVRQKQERKEVAVETEAVKPKKVKEVATPAPVVKSVNVEKIMSPETRQRVSLRVEIPQAVRSKYPVVDTIVGDFVRANAQMLEQAVSRMVAFMEAKEKQVATLTESYTNALADADRSRAIASNLSDTVDELDDKVEALTMKLEAAQAKLDDAETKGCGGSCESCKCDK